MMKRVDLHQQNHTGTYTGTVGYHRVPFYAQERLRFLDEGTRINSKRLGYPRSIIPAIRVGMIQ